MERFFTQIKWIDPNGNGIISEYTFMALSHLGARKKSLEAFWKEKEKIWGGKNDIEIRSVESGLLKDGLLNQMRWNNSK